MSERPSVMVVHLARHREHRQRLSAALRRHGFTRVLWLKAVDGRTLDPAPPCGFTPCRRCTPGAAGSTRMSAAP